jgi:hypothetical protein
MYYKQSTMFYNKQYKNISHMTFFSQESLKFHFAFIHVGTAQ